MHLVVIGGVAAGLSAAARAKRLDRSCSVTVLEKTGVISYSACGLPYYVEGRVPGLDKLVVFTPEEFRSKRDVDVRTDAEAREILHPQRAVVLSSGERVRYDKLVVATGARPDRSLMPEGGAPGVFVLHTLAHAEAMDRFIRTDRPKRAAVVGGSYLGLELAEALRTRGLSVTLFSAGSDFLKRQDPGLNEAVAETLERFRIDLRSNARVRRVEPGKVDGEAFDLIALATGVRPNSEVAATAGIRLGASGGVTVDDRMETSVPGIFAAGDCCEARHRVSGRPVYMPLGTTANKMGRVAGANTVGGRETFPGIAGTSIVRICELGIGMTGFSVAQARREGFDAESVEIRAKDKPGYFGGESVAVNLVAERGSGRLLGGRVMGRQGVAGRVNVLATAISAELTVDAFEQMDLAYAPPFATVWDPLLIAAQQLKHLL